jgi:death on curing protein
MREPRWIQDRAVHAIHSRQLAEHGGLDGVRDEGLLSSALARPRHIFAYTNPKPDLATLAAAYAYGIVQNHPFLDGNKRTAFVVCRTFVKINGHEINASEGEKYMTFLGVADGSVGETTLADWIRSHLIKSRSRS